MESKVKREKCIHRFLFYLKFQIKVYSIRHYAFCSAVGIFIGEETEFESELDLFEFSVFDVLLKETVLSLVPTVVILLPDSSDVEFIKSDVITLYKLADIVSVELAFIESAILELNPSDSI